MAKSVTSGYGSGRRGWIKRKNPNYWRLDLEREAISAGVKVVPCAADLRIC